MRDMLSNTNREYEFKENGIENGKGDSIKRNRRSIVLY
jgi:hypothetical protein